MIPRALMKDRCTIENYSVDRTQKTAVETWRAQTVQTRCRALKREASSFNPEKGTRTTQLRVRFMLPKNAMIDARDKIQHAGRKYEVLEINAVGGYKTDYLIAICDGQGKPVS